jgi:hypothetical protein
VLLGWVEARFQAIGTSMWPADRAEYDHDVAATSGRLSDARFTRAWAKGSAMAYDEALAYMLTSHQPCSGADCD